MGIDVWEVIEARRPSPSASRRSTPGPGLGGHCIPIDPFYLSWKALDVFEELRQLGADVEFHDPFVPSFRFVEETIEGTTREDALQRDYDLMIVTTDHSDVDYGAFLERKIPVLDTRNALRGSDAAHVHGL
jgi:UDP-N-acetyl-D-mannosaminuronate dehydrogenase